MFNPRFVTLLTTESIKKSMDKKFKTTTLPREAHAGTMLFIIFGGIIVLVAGLSIIGHYAVDKGDPAANGK